MANKTDYVDLGLACVDVCRALDRGIKGRPLDGLSQSVFEAIAQLTKWVRLVMRVVHDPLITLNHRTVAEIQERVIEKGGRNLLSRIVHARNDKEVMVTWRSDLNRVLHVFNVRSAPSVR